MPRIIHPKHGSLIPGILFFFFLYNQDGTSKLNARNPDFVHTKVDHTLIHYNKTYPYPELISDLRYSTENNFLKTQLYPENTEVWLEPNTARAIRQVQYDALKYGVQLIIWDAYRPWSVTAKMYELAPHKKYVADPAKGSVHNRGCAVDISLCDLNGNLLEMPTDFDVFGIKSLPTYQGGTEVSRQNRDLLIRLMEHRGFKVNKSEWWHFEYKDAYSHPVLDGFAE